MDDAPRWLILITAAYLLGSVPFAFILGRLKGVDIRQHGSGNVGASNAGRVLGRPYGYACFVLDVLKGLTPVAIAGAWAGLYGKSLEELMVGEMFLWLATGAAAILGHMHSVFLKFTGGKGVATGFGVMLGIYPHFTYPALGALVVWLVAIKLTRWISVASMAAALSLPVWFFLAAIPHDLGANAEASAARGLVHGWPFLVVAVALGLLVVYKHRTNIGRLINGTEPRIGDPIQPGHGHPTPFPRATESGNA